MSYKYNLSIVVVLIISGSLSSNGKESSSIHRIKELAQSIVSETINRHSDESRMKLSECASVRCNLAINISALAASQEFTELVNNVESLEVLNIRFEGINAPTTYDCYRNRASSESPSIVVDSGGGRIETIVLKSSEQSFDWEVFDPLWWMWATNNQHFVFRMPLLDLDILSVGRVF